MLLNSLDYEDLATLQDLFDYYLEQFRLTPSISEDDYFRRQLVLKFHLTKLNRRIIRQGGEYRSF